MSKNTILSISVFALLALGAIAIKTCTSNVKVQANTESIADHKDDTIRRYKDLYKTAHAEKLEAVGSLAALRVTYKHDIDSVCKRVNIKPNQLNGIDEVSTITADSYTARIDTVYLLMPGGQVAQRHFLYAPDKWFTLDGFITDTTISGTYKCEDSLVLTSAWKRRWLLGAKTVYKDAYSLNPNTTIKGLTALRVSEKVPGRFGIGPYVGVSLSGPSIGIALTYSIIRF